MLEPVGLAGGLDMRYQRGKVKNDPEDWLTWLSG